jgi:hypothetical protein
VIGITPGFEPTAKMLCESLAESGPVEVSEFDDAWTPAGENYRDELVSGRLVTVEQLQEDGPHMVVLTGVGVALAQSTTEEA